MNRKIEEVFLQPNHKAIYLKRKKTVIPDDIVREIEKPLQPKKLTISKTIKVEPAISWREGKLVFVDESFDMIAEKLERRFGVQIHIETDRIKKIRYTGVLKNISIEQALRAMQLTTKFSFTINENIITISDEENSIK
jgi:ferric-dicitrate binding protein FerR (iron transport regulator)